MVVLQRRYSLSPLVNISIVHHGDLPGVTIYRHLMSGGDSMMSEGHISGYSHAIGYMKGGGVHLILLPLLYPISTARLSFGLGPSMRILILSCPIKGGRASSY